MYLLYLDDSGNSNDASQRYFVLAGLSVFERQGHWLSEQLDAIAARFNPADPSSVELHGSPMLTGSKFWRSVPRSDRIQAIRDALGVFAVSHRDNRAFGVAVQKEAISPRDAVDYAFEQISSRFDHYLMRLFKSGNPQRGLMILDKSTREAAIQNLAIDFKNNGHSFGKLRNMAEVPVFLDSRNSRLVQLADLIAYAIFQKFERDQSFLFDIFASRFDSSGGIIHGLHVYDRPATP
ncbi:DUF3800 domain-containing protein [Magnetospirillum fulvum]|uniref:DUF3800 domain-containing protein n=1 Tax=Magnetospirillum fulvum MGU-K5 TaxID=1316936 RepID=S9TU35_MAGFU|nr:DUF3800 domain-containing protein [Magnetospirillum fulvum]EPY02000.1 hypothetical protein K678_07902 [Magnetospirillum fulvum MGU-K5]